MFATLYWVTVSFAKIVLVQAVPHSVRKLIYVRHFHLYFPIWGVLTQEFDKQCCWSLLSCRKIDSGKCNHIYTCTVIMKEKNTMVISLYCVEIHIIWIWLLLRLFYGIRHLTPLWPTKHFVEQRSGILEGQNSYFLLVRQKLYCYFHLFDVL